MSSCETNPFPNAGTPYRYFNQPVELVPGWSAGDAQALVHGENGGLIWKTVKCLDVVTCVKLQGAELIIERRNITVLSEDDPVAECDNIPTIACPIPSPSP